MKIFILLAVLSLSFCNYSTGQILCIHCYDTNDSVSYGVTNLLLNGGFEDTPCPASTGVIGSPTSFCPNSGGYVCDLANWTCTGGGNQTYSCIYDTYINKSIINEGQNSVYFGNYYCNACSPQYDDVSCITYVDCGATGIPAGYPQNFNAGFGGSTGVSLEQTVNGLTTGNTYVLEFWAGGEQSYTYKGLFALDVGFGDTMLTCRSTGPLDIGIVYVVQFNATSPSHTIKFTNWGHVCYSCTELVLDNVRLYTLAELSDSVPHCESSIANSFSASDTDLCEKFCIDFYDSSQNNPTAWQWIFPGGTPSSSTDQNPIDICYQVPGVFDVTLITTNANGSDTLTLTDYITVNPTPPFPAITQAGYTLTSSSSSSYQWQFNSADIPGATNQSYTVLQTGYYTVVVGDENGCKNSTTLYVLIDGLGDVNGDMNIFIYPNPSPGKFIVELLNGLTANEVTIDVVNTLGQKVFSSIESRSIGTSEWKKEIDLQNIASGVYFIEIKTANTLSRKKIILE